MSTYYGEVVTEDEVKAMFDRVTGAAEHDFLFDEKLSAEERRIRLAELAAVRELASTMLDLLKIDEFRSLGPAQELAKLRGYLGERKDNG